jgi:EAL and modified HD-GYP domain-containing signal transduction protein
MAGVISGVAALLGLSRTTMVAQLPLSVEMSAALVRGTGPLGRVLHVADAYETGVAGAADLASHYMEALRWSTRAVQATALAN